MLRKNLLLIKKRVEFLKDYTLFILLIFYIAIEETLNSESHFKNDPF